MRIVVDFLNGKQHGLYPVYSVQVDIVRLSIILICWLHNMYREQAAEYQVTFKVRYPAGISAVLRMVCFRRLSFVRSGYQNPKGKH